MQIEQFEENFLKSLVQIESTLVGDYKFILNYQDHATKFLQLRPLRNKSASEVSEKVIEIFYQ